MRAVLVVNPKGGCGKTTLATNLAGCLANRGDSVVLWDLDRQKSSLEWLALRSPELPVIHSLEGKDEPSGKQKRKHDWLIMDTRAGLHGKNLERAIKPVDKVLMPIQPSLYDMAATRDFLAVLHEEHLLRKGKYFLGIVGMRVDARTRAAVTLEAFLKQFELPVLTYLRDTQVYTNAAFQGKSIFDLPHYLNEKDVADWQPLLIWLAK
ncbi:MAG: ParA family protein [Betaproteobacteria bacterium]|nr:ParA family protein [Betaproteobacteria bacterium]